MEPPSESGIDIKQLRKQLANALGGRFQNLRMAMLNLHTEEDQNLLARVTFELIGFQKILKDIYCFLVSSFNSMGFNIQTMPSLYSNIASQSI